MRAAVRAPAADEARRLTDDAKNGKEPADEGESHHGGERACCVRWSGEGKANDLAAAASSLRLAGAGKRLMRRCGDGRG